MTESGDPKDNAIAERINNTLKNELFRDIKFHSIAEVRKAMHKAAENREARKQFANQDTAELTNEHKTIRDGWGDDLDRDNVDMGDPATQAQFETDQARYRALNTELDARRADTEQAPRRNRADQSVAADADQGDDYLNSLAAAEPTTDQPDPDLINDLSTRTDADLEAMDLNTNTPGPVRDAIGREGHDCRGVR